MTRRIDEIRERLNNATPGPWKVIVDNGQWDSPRICMATDGTLAQHTHYGHMREDSQFIAHAPEDIAYLLRIAEAAANGSMITIEQCKNDVKMFLSQQAKLFDKEKNHLVYRLDKANDDHVKEYWKMKRTEEKLRAVISDLMENIERWLTHNSLEDEDRAREALAKAKELMGE